MKTLASIRKNETNYDDLPFILNSMGVALPQDIIEAALKNMAHRGEDLMFLITFTSAARVVLDCLCLWRCICFIRYELSLTFHLMRFWTLLCKVQFYS